MHAVLFRWIAAGILATVAALGGARGSGQTVDVASGTPAAEERPGAAYLGVRLVEETEHPEGGARITHVVKGSPAAKAGLEQGDVVISFDGAVVRGPAALTARIEAREPEERVQLKVRRAGAVRTVEVELGRRSPIAGIAPLPEWDVDRWEEWQEQFDKRMEDLGERLSHTPHAYSFALPDAASTLPFVVWGKPKLGVELVETTPELRAHLGGDEDRGVLVSRVLEGSPAERAGLRVGDLILTVGDQPVATVAELRDALRERDGSTFPVTVARDRKTTTVDVTLPEPDADRPTGPRAGLRRTPAPVTPAPAAPLAPAPPLPAPAPPPPGRTI